MTRQLISVIQFVKEAKERGDDLNTLFIDPDEVAELEEESNEED